jgi:hypothetical protein
MPNYQDYLPDTRPFSQAIQTYATLKGVDRADEELRLRREEAEANREQRTWQRGITERQEGRADTELARSGAIHDAAMRKTGREEEAAGNAKKAFQIKADAARRLINGDYVAPAELAQVTVHGVALPTPGKGASFETYHKGLSNLAQFGEELPEITGNAPSVMIQRDPRNPGRENLFRSLKTVTRPREGRVNTYEARDPTTGEPRKVLGTVGDVPAAILYDKRDDTVSIMFQVVDPKTGEPLLGLDGKPITAPATEGMSSDGEDKVVRVPRSVLIQTAREGMAANANAAKTIRSYSPVQQRIHDLALRIELGGEDGAKASAEFDNIQSGFRMADGYDSVITNMERRGQTQTAAYQQAVIVRDLLREGKTTPEMAEKMAGKAVADLVQKEEVAHKGAVKEAEAKAEFTNKTGPEIEARGAIDLKKQQEADAAALERTKLTEAGADRRTAATNAAHLQGVREQAAAARAAREEKYGDMPESVRRTFASYDKADDRVATIALSLQKEYDDQTKGLSRKFKTVQDYLNSSEAYKNARDNAREIGNRIRGMGFDPLTGTRGAATPESGAGPSGFWTGGDAASSSAAPAIPSVQPTSPVGSRPSGGAIASVEPQPVQSEFDRGMGFVNKAGFAAGTRAQYVRRLETARETNDPTRVQEVIRDMMVEIQRRR